MPAPPRNVGLVARALISAVVAALVATSCASLTPEELADAYRPPDISNLGLEDPLPPPEPDPDPEAESGSANDSDDADDTTGAEPTATGSPEGRLPRAKPLVADFGECWFDSSGYDVDCGWIHIPSELDGVDPVRLSFAHFRASASDVHDDPVVYLHGGPGGAVLEFADFLTTAIVDPFIDTRDVVLYDQRGAGQSSPLPVCNEALGLDLRFFSGGEPHDEIEPAYITSLDRCAERVERRRDIALSEYNSAVHADDLLDLVRALRFETVNLYGNSYGTRLAQTMMRDHPERVRSVILSGVYPIEENLVGSVPETFRAALDQVFATCVGEPTCAAQLPDPWVALDAIVTGLDESPVAIDLDGIDTGPFTFEVSGDDLINLLHGLLYTAGGAAIIPDLLVDLRDGHTTRLSRLGAEAIFDTSDVLGFMTVQCREEVPFTTHEQAEEATRTDTPWHRAGLAPGLIGGVLLETCPLFASIGSALPLENEPVTWDHPTLILSGAFDPITPPWWAESVAARLPNATLAFFADRGHDADEGFCAWQLKSDFVSDPTTPLDESCLGSDDALELPNTPERLVSPTDAALTTGTFDIDPGAASVEIQVLLPQWEVDVYATEHAYWRDLDPYDPTVLVVRSGGWEPGEVTWYLTEESPLGWESTPTPGDISPRWERLVHRTGTVDAVSYVIDEDGLSMNISIVAAAVEIEALERAVLRAVVASVDLP